MPRLGDFLDGVSVWLGSNMDSAGAFVLIAAVVTLLSACLCILIVMALKQSAATELAHYGGSSRSLRSFVCKVCLHRSYAESHIRQRYCAKCDKSFPETVKVWNFPEIVGGEYPTGSTTMRYRNLTERAGPDHRRKTRA